MPNKTLAPPRLGRTGWTILVAIAALSIIAGIWPITGTLTTLSPELAVPAAFGMPYLLPPLRLAPLGLTTWSFWWADTVGAIVMLATAWAMLRARGAKHPTPGFWRSFGQGMWVTAGSVIAGNIVRGIWLSFATQSNLPTYLAMLGIGVIVSLLEGLVLGILPGLAAGIAAAVRTPNAPTADPERAPAS